MNSFSAILGIAHCHMTDTLAHEIGKPILAVNLRGIAEVIHDGENGCLFSQGDPESFTQKLIKLASDAEVRTATGKEALNCSLETNNKNEIEKQIVAAIQGKAESNNPSQPFQ